MLWRCIGWALMYVYCCYGCIFMYASKVKSRSRILGAVSLPFSMLRYKAQQKMSSKEPSIQPYRPNGEPNPSIPTNQSFPTFPAPTFQPLQHPPVPRRHKPNPRNNTSNVIHLYLSKQNLSSPPTTKRPPRHKRYSTRLM